MKRLSLLVSVMVFLSVSVCFSDIIKVDDSSIQEEVTTTETKAITYKADYLLRQKAAIEKDLARVQSELDEINRLINGAEAVGVSVVTEEWVQPTAEDPYMLGDKVVFEGAIYVSNIDNNVWSPGAYPQGWDIVE